MCRNSGLSMTGVFFILVRMQITVFGAAGKVGRLVVADAQARGHTVRAFVHSHDPFTLSDTLTVVKGDVNNAERVTKALEGSQAVISCLGSWGTPGKNVLTTAMQTLIPAMESQNINRIITLTGSGAIAPDKVPGLFHVMTMKLLAPFPAGKVFADGEAHMRLLADSKLYWTTIRSPVMNSRKDAGYKLSLEITNHFRFIPRQSVAVSMLDQLDSTEWLHQAPVISRARKQ